MDLIAKSLMGSYAKGPIDPYFEYTTLLLSGNGLNGAQNGRSGPAAAYRDGTFLDGSTNNFTITRNGNTTQGTFSPFSQTGWGNYFDGNGDYLNLTQSVFAVGTSNFTLEAWVYLTAAPTGEAGVISSFNTGAGQGFYLAVNGSRQPFATIGNGAVGNPTVTGSAISLNTWVHLAMVRLSGTIYLYVNGSSVGTPISAGASIDRTLLGIGLAYPNSPQGYITGYISNARVTTIAVYTGNFTPPTSPLAATQSAGTNISAITGTQTSLLTCQSNRFIDNSTNNFTITVNGDTRVVAFSPFNPTASWSAATYGGSGYFDGSGDYLTATNNSAYDFGSGDFTIEAFAYPTTASQLAVCARGETTGFSGFILSTTNFLATTNGSSWDISISFTTALTANAWNHVALVRNGNVYTAYLNGVANGTTTVSGAIVAGTAALTIGRRAGQTDYSGYLSSLRLVKGTAVYTAAFTPPTTPVTAITNTVLLLNFTNAGIYDATSKNDLETVGNAQISTAISAKWGSGSMYFDGTGDYLQAPYQTLSADFGTGQFTIELWVYFSSSVSTTQMFVSSNYNASTGAGGWAFLRRGDNNTIVFNQGLNVAYGKTWSPSLNIWYHCAVTRDSSNNLRIFVNGTQVGSTDASVTASINGATSLLIGTNQITPFPLTGYLQDVRITKGYARYTANFTAPTEPFLTL